jgi:hypothetical protein
MPYSSIEYFTLSEEAKSTYYIEKQADAC